jgi:hypothetical protein
MESRGRGVAAGIAVAAGVMWWCRGRTGWRWMADGPLLEARTEHVAVLLEDGRVLVAGGSAPDDQVLMSAELRAASTGTWDAAAPMSVPRAGAAAIRLMDGRVLVVGGWTTGGATASAEIWDPASETWTATGSMTHARSGHAAVLLNDGRVLVAGGGSPGGFPEQAERYDVVTGTWAPVGALSQGRKNLSLTRLTDGTVLAAGGDGAGDVGVTTCERFDPATEAWSLTGPMSTGRSHDEAGGFASTLLGDGRVLVAGGFRLNGGSTYLKSAESYGQATGAWSSLPPLPGPGRVLPAAATLDDGTGLVVGGWTGDVALADTFHCESAAGTWSTLPPLATPRAGHTATTLPGGDVLVVGGFSEVGLVGTTERLVRRTGCCGIPLGRS